MVGSFFLRFAFLLRLDIGVDGTMAGRHHRSGTLRSAVTSPLGGEEACSRFGASRSGGARSARWSSRSGGRPWRAARDEAPVRHLVLSWSRGDGRWWWRPGKVCRSGWHSSWHGPSGIDPDGPGGPTRELTMARCGVPNFGGGGWCRIASVGQRRHPLCYSKIGRAHV